MSSYSTHPSTPEGRSNGPRRTGARQTGGALAICFFLSHREIWSRGAAVFGSEVGSKTEAFLFFIFSFRAWDGFAESESQSDVVGRYARVEVKPRGHCL